jgi:mannose-6-phosphate isomerase-like protein (cupin superfamily)
MKIAMMALAGVLLAGAPAFADEPMHAACPAFDPATYSLKVLRNYRVYTDPATGDSKVEQVPIPIQETPLLKTGKILKLFDFGPAKRVEIVIAPADLDLPLHPAPYKERFLTLAGSTDMVVADGTKIHLGPGDMVTMDDMTSKSGHGGRIGPCGYIDLDMRPAD